MLVDRITTQVEEKSEFESDNPNLTGNKVLIALPVQTTIENGKTNFRGLVIKKC